MLDIGKDMMNGLVDGVTSMATTVKKKVEDAVDSVVSGVKDFLGIKSPSRLMRDEVGKMMGLGVGEGISASTKNVMKNAQKFTKTISSGLAVQASDINAGLNGSIDSVKGSSFAGAPVTNVTNNYNQTINSPKALDRKTIYRNSKRLTTNMGGY